MAIEKHEILVQCHKCLTSHVVLTFALNVYSNQVGEIPCIMCIISLTPIVNLWCFCVQVIMERFTLTNISTYQITLQKCQLNISQYFENAPFTNVIIIYRNKTKQYYTISHKNLHGIGLFCTVWWWNYVQLQGL